MVQTKTTGVFLRKRFTTPAEYEASLTYEDLIEITGDYELLAQYALASSATDSLRMGRFNGLMAKAAELKAKATSLASSGGNL